MHCNTINIHTKKMQMHQSRVLLGSSLFYLVGSHKIDWQWFISPIDTFSFLTSIVFAPCVCLHRQNWSKLVVLVFCWSICQNVNYHEKGIFLPSFNIHIIVFGCSGFESGISWHSKRKLSFVQKQEIISINGSIKPNLFRHYVVCLCMYSRTSV